MKLECLQTNKAPNPLGGYSHAVLVGEFIFTAGIGPRHPSTNEIPGSKWNIGGEKISYDIRLETRQTLENIQTILEEAGSSLDHIVEINTFLTNMKDFEAYNEVYSSFFQTHKPARTTIGVLSLPGGISIEMKAIAVKKK